jgi:hypothetical protein
MHPLLLLPGNVPAKSNRSKNTVYGKAVWCETETQIITLNIIAYALRLFNIIFS